MPSSYNGFAFVIDGSVQIGETVLDNGQVGWLDRPGDDGASVVRLVGRDSGAQVILYAGQRQGDPIVSHGPFPAGHCKTRCSVSGRTVSSSESMEKTAPL